MSTASDETAAPFRPCSRAPFSSSSSMLDLLIGTHVGDLAIDCDQLVSFQWDDRLDVALTTLSSRHILSAPVLSEELGGFCAFVDLADFLVYLTEQIEENEVIEGPARLLDLAARHVVGDLIDWSGRNPWLPIQECTTLINALAIMVSNRAKRLAIVSPDSVIIGIVTESDLVKFLDGLASSPPLLNIEPTMDGANVRTPVATFFDVLISDLPCLTSPVLTVSLKSTVMEAFNLMVTMRLSGLAVVDSEGFLVGNISLSDLKNIHFDLGVITRSHFTVEEYLELSQPTGRRCPISVRSSQTLREAIHTLVEHSVHRVYVVRDTDAKNPEPPSKEISARRLHCGAVPSAVLSLCDILENVLRLAQAHHPVHSRHPNNRNGRNLSSTPQHKCGFPRCPPTSSSTSSQETHQSLSGEESSAYRFPAVGDTPTRSEAEHTCHLEDHLDEGMSEVLTQVSEDCPDSLSRQLSSSTSATPPPTALPAPIAITCSLT